LTFVAITLTLILSPRFKLKGALVSVDNGTVHSVCEAIKEFDPSQLISSCENVIPSLYLT
jgi:hypothetical protein